MTDSGYEYDVFISFASDDQPLVRPLWQELTGGGLRVFWSDSSLRDRAGSSWFDVIQQSLINSRHLAVVFTPAALHSEWVRREYVAFFTHYYRPPGRLLVPILAATAEVSELPLFLRELEACRLNDSATPRRLIRLFGGIDVEALRAELVAANDRLHAIVLQRDSLLAENQRLLGQTKVVDEMRLELTSRNEVVSSITQAQSLLESERDSLRSERDVLQSQVSALAKRVANDGGQSQRDLQRLRDERDALLARVAELQQSSSRRGIAKDNSEPTPNASSVSDRHDDRKYMRKDIGFVLGRFFRNHPRIRVALRFCLIGMLLNLALAVIAPVIGVLTFVISSVIWTSAGLFAGSSSPRTHVLLISGGAVVFAFVFGYGVRYMDGGILLDGVAPLLIVLVQRLRLNAQRHTKRVFYRP